MKRMFMLLVAVVALGSVMAAAPARAQVMISADELFEYDKDVPLDAKRELLADKGMYTIDRVEYSSVNAQRVPGWLVLPTKGEGPFPCVIVGHGAEGSKQDFETLYGFLAVRGYASFAIDAQYHGERKVEGKKLFTGQWYEMRTVMVQTVIDSRRGIDYLETLDEIDPDRIAYFGISMGVLIGTPFLALDERVKTSILLVGGGDYEIIMNESKLLPFVLLRYTSGLPVHEVAEKFAPVDPVNYIGRFSPRPLLMMNGKNDNIIPPAAAQALFDAAGEPKDIRWFESGHIPPFDKVMNISAKWLKRFLMDLEPEKEDESVKAPEEYTGGEVKLETSISEENVGGERIVTIAAMPEPEKAKGMIVEAMFQELDIVFELRDDGFRGDEAALDGVYSIKLPIERILEGIIPESIYDCSIRVRTEAGKVLAEEYAGNVMLRE